METVPMKSFRLPALLVLFSVFGSTAVHADFLLTISDGTITPGGTATVDVFIEGDGVTEDLQEFSLVLSLSAIQASGDSSLIFLDPQTETHLDPGNVDQYVFVDTSDAIAGGIETATVASDTELNYFDTSLDLGGDPVDVAVSGPRLIASVDVTHLLDGTDPTLTFGDQYILSVDEDASEFFADGAFDTTFFSSVSGSLTVVPEPGCASLFLVCSGLLVTRRARRRIS